jgi:hypothetical protein
VIIYSCLEDFHKRWLSHDLSSYWLLPSAVRKCGLSINQNARVQ